MAISDRMKRMHSCVGITLKNGKDLKGELYHCYSNEPIVFNDVEDFFCIVNSFLDVLEYPASKVKYRAFKKTLPTMKLIDIDPKEKLFDTEKLLTLCDRKAYIILIIGRDNATWQGMVYSKSEDKEYTFKSEVELLRILNK